MHVHMSLSLYAHKFNTITPLLCLPVTRVDNNMLPQALCGQLNMDQSSKVVVCCYALQAMDCMSLQDHSQVLNRHHSPSYCCAIVMFLVASDIADQYDAE